MRLLIAVHICVCGGGCLWECVRLIVRLLLIGRGITGILILVWVLRRMLVCDCVGMGSDARTCGLYKGGRSAVQVGLSAAIDLAVRVLVR